MLGWNYRLSEFNAAIALAQLEKHEELINLRIESAKIFLEVMEKAIIDANLGFTPMNNGEVIMINIPPITEERRRELVRQAKSETEHAKVSIRNARKEANDELKKITGLSEDLAKDSEVSIQNITNDYTSRADAYFLKKEAEIMTV